MPVPCTAAMFTLLGTRKENVETSFRIQELRRKHEMLIRETGAELRQEATEESREKRNQYNCPYNPCF